MLRSGQRRERAQRALNFAIDQKCGGAYRFSQASKRCLALTVAHLFDGDRGGEEARHEHNGREQKQV